MSASPSNSPRSSSVWLALLGGAPAMDGMSGAMGEASGGEDAGGGAPGGFGAAVVDVTAVLEIVAAEAVQLLGTAAPVRASLVAAEVDGLVGELGADEGDMVAEGAVLVRLQTTGVQQRLDAAAAARQESAARLARAESDFARLASLRERQAISEREYDQALADRDALTQANLRLDAEISLLQEQLDKAVVRAPYRGQVTAVQVDVGEWVGRGDAIVSLVDLSAVEVTVQVAERYISAVKRGFRVDVAFDALPGTLFPGTVTAVVPQAVPEARTFPVLVQVANREGRIKGGMAARVIAQLGDPEPSLLVPKDALVRRGSQVSVYRLSPGALGAAPDAAPAAPGPGTQGMIEVVEVEYGPARGEWQTVFGPLRAGDLVIVRGNERVFPGMPGVVGTVRTPAIPAADPDRPIAIDPR